MGELIINLFANLGLLYVVVGNPARLGNRMYKRQKNIFNLFLK